VSVDVAEFQEIKKQLELRFGREFVAAALQNTTRVVSGRVRAAHRWSTPLPAS
jgi:hypothetical protein